MTKNNLYDETALVGLAMVYASEYIFLRRTKWSMAVYTWNPTVVGKLNYVYPTLPDLASQNELLDLSD